MARRHEAHVHRKHLVAYGAVMVVVLVIGGLALWSFFEKQSLVVDPEPLPKLTVVTADANSRLAAAWVTLLTKAGLQATLVPLEKLDRLDGVIVFCGVPSIPQRLVPVLDTFARRGGSLAFAGIPPANPIGKLHLSAKLGSSDTAIKLSESPSPLLARLVPGSEVQMRRSMAAMLEESPQMIVDARWQDKARAAIMHMEDGNARYLWMGFDPDALVEKDDRQMLLLLRTAFRWAAGQPVSEGAVGAVALAKAFAPESRREARTQHFVFGVDRLSNPRLLLLHLANRGAKPIENPSVEVWLPPRATKLAVAGTLFLKSDVAISEVQEEKAWVISATHLAPGEDRLVKLRIDTSLR